jgi:hypothetical protein
MTGWFSASIAALAITGLVAGLMVPVMVRLMLAAATRWPRLSGWSPMVTLTAIAMTPIMVGLAIGIGAFWPGFLGHVLHLCHCGTEFTVAEHSSILHPELSVSLLPYSLILLFVLLVRPLRVFVSSYSAQRVARRALPIQERSVYYAGKQVRLHRIGNANAFTAGFLRPTIYADGPWWDSLSSKERDIVATHESCHQRHWDPLALLIVRVSIAYLSAHKAGDMISLFVLQMESRADRQAMKSTGDALGVAEFLLRAHQGAANRSLALAFVGTGIERRIEALVDAADGRCSKDVALAQWFSFVGVSGLVALTFVFRGIFHRAAEFILAIF